MRSSKPEGVHATTIGHSRTSGQGCKNRHVSLQKARPDIRGAEMATDSERLSPNGNYCLSEWASLMAAGKPFSWATAFTRACSVGFNPRKAPRY